jgi:hypothetical protein
MLAYCDFIADRIRKGLLNSMGDSLEPVRLKDLSKVEYDLTDTGAFASTTKTLYVSDGNGKRYKITVQESA